MSILQLEQLAARHGVYEELKAFGKKSEESRQVLAKVDTIYSILCIRDDSTAKHSETMAYYAYHLAQLQQEEEPIIYYLGGICHDSGKIFMKDSILKGSKKLSLEERESLKEHVYDSVLLLNLLNMPKVIIEMAEHHHERFNGAGYPRQIRGYQIPVSGRIAAIADVFSAIIENRRYRDALPMDGAIRTILSIKEQFDEEILDSFISLLSSLKNQTREEAVI